MCKDHSNVLVDIPGATPRGHLGTKRGIDGCIAPLVEALNAAGFPTVASCCGHGNRPGSIVLEDGREFIIAPDYNTARRIDGLFPHDIHGRTTGERGEALGGSDKSRPNFPSRCQRTVWDPMQGRSTCGRLTNEYGFCWSGHKNDPLALQEDKDEAR